MKSRSKSPSPESVGEHNRQQLVLQLTGWCLADGTVANVVVLPSIAFWGDENVPEPVEAVVVEEPRNSVVAPPCVPTPPVPRPERFRAAADRGHHRANEKLAASPPDKADALEVVAV